MKHVEIIKAWLDGAEVQFLSDEKYWVSLSPASRSSYMPKFTDRLEYRIKPKNVININGFDIHEPLREAPKDYTKVYLVNTTAEKCHCVSWDSDGSIMNRWLKLGLLHDNLEDAELHRKALISFTEQK